MEYWAEGSADNVRYSKAQKLRVVVCDERGCGEASKKEKENKLNERDIFKNEVIKVLQKKKYEKVSY